MLCELVAVDAWYSGGLVKADENGDDDAEK